MRGRGVAWSGSLALAITLVGHAVPARGEAPTTYVHEVPSGAMVADGLWIEAPYRLTYWLDPPSVRLGSTIVARDDSLLALFGFEPTPSTVTVGGDPVVDQRRRYLHMPVPEERTIMSGLTTRIMAFVLSGARDGMAARAIGDGLGRFLLHDGAVLGADIDGGIVELSLDLEGRVKLHFPVPDSARVARIDAHVRGRLAVVGDVTGRLAWYQSGRLLWVAGGPETRLLARIASDIRHPGATPWLLRGLYDNVGGYGPLGVNSRLITEYGARVADSMLASGYPEGIEGLWFLRSDDRWAMAFRATRLNRVATILEAEMGVKVDVPFVHRHLPVTYYSQDFESAEALGRHIARENGLEIERREDGTFAVSPVEGLAPGTVRERGEVVWITRPLETAGQWQFVSRNTVVHLGPSGEVRGTRSHTGKLGWQLGRDLFGLSPLAGEREDEIYFGTPRGALVELVGRSGRVEWGYYLLTEIPTVGGHMPSVRPVAVLDDHLLAVQDERYLLSVDHRRGGVRRRLDLTTETNPGGAVTPDHVVFATRTRVVAVTDDGELVAFRSGDYPPPHRVTRAGAAWVVETPAGLQVLSPSLEEVTAIDLAPGAVWAVVKDRVAVAGRDPEVGVREGPDWSITHRVRLGGTPTAVIDADDRIYVACADGFIYRIHPETGEREERVPAEVPHGAPVVVEGRGMAHPTWSGRLVGVRLR